MAAIVNVLDDCFERTGNMLDIVARRNTPPVFFMQTLGHRCYEHHTMEFEIRHALSHPSSINPTIVSVRANYTLDHTAVYLVFAPPSCATINKEEKTVTFQGITWDLSTWTEDYNNKIIQMNLKENIPNNGFIIDIDRLEPFMSKIRPLCLAHHAEWMEAKTDELHNYNSSRYIAICMATHSRLGYDARINGLGSLQPELIRIIANKMLANDVQAFTEIINAPSDVSPSRPVSPASSPTLSYTMSNPPSPRSDSPEY